MNQNRKSMWVVGLGGLVLMVLGCQPQEPNGKKTDRKEPIENKTVEIQPIKSDSIDLQVGDVASLNQLLEKHRGKVVLVDFWATWCGPCVTMFPHTVELSRQFGPEKLAVISVSLDEPDDQQQVQTFLEKKNARFDNLLSSYGVGSDASEQFEIPNGSIPHFRIYNQAGELEFSSDSNEELEATINGLLK